MSVKNTTWKGWDLEKAAAAFVEAFIQKPAPVIRSDEAETVAALKVAMAENGVAHCEWQKVGR